MKKYLLIIIYVEKSVCIHSEYLDDYVWSPMKSSF